MMSNTNKNGQIAENGGAVQETSATTVPAADKTPAIVGGGAKSTALIEMLQKYGLPDDKVQAATAQLDELGVDTVDELGALSAEELGELGLKPVKARKLLEEVKKADATEAPPMATAAQQVPVRQVVTPTSMLELLPVVPADEAWLTSLKTGGVLKVGPDAYTAAFRAALASKVGMFDVPKKLTKAMEDFALENDEPVSVDFYAIQKQLTRRSYAEIFEALEGANGTFVTEARKKQLMNRMEEYVWPAIANTYQQLINWRDICLSGTMNPQAMVSFFSGMQTGIPANLFTAIPDTAILHDAGDDLRDAINKALAGVGCLVASGMAYDYMQIKKALDNPSLPAQIGATNREQMFKKLNLSVSSSVIRSEASIIRYLMGFVLADDQPADMEAQYFAALFQLGTQIDWRQLGIDVSSSFASPTVAPPRSGFEGLTGGRL